MGHAKQIMLLAGKPLCRYAAEAMAQAGHDALLAVVPPGEVGAQVRAALAGLPFQFVENPEPSRGLGSSFRVAIEAVQALPEGVARQVAGVNFALADMPFISPQVHEALLEAFRGAHAPGQGCGCEPEVESSHGDNLPLVLAEYGSAETGVVRAPPHLFRADLLQEVLASPEADQVDHGPRQLIKKYAHDGLVVRFPAELLLDVDTPDDLAQAGAKLQP